MGVPRQEQFIHKHGDELGATVRPGVGALFDFFRLDAAGAMACAQAGGAYGLMMEPRRLFRRYVLGNPQFLARVMWRRMRSRMALTQGPLSG